MKPTANKQHSITGVILAGGRARRMHGQDKGLVIFNHKPMIEYVIDVLSPQVDHLIINANRNHARYASYGIDIIKDDLPGYCGPLAGVAATLDRIKTKYLVTAPCDTPFLPNDLVQRLYAKLTDHHAQISVAHDGERIQPVFFLIHQKLSQSLQHYLASGEKKIEPFFTQHNTVTVDFSDKKKHFDNLNCPKDLASAKLK